MTHQRRVIPAGPAADPIQHIYPIIDFLESRGLLLTTRDTGERADREGALGFYPFLGRKECAVDGLITTDLWAAIRDEFDLPPTITYNNTNFDKTGRISDEINQVEIIGSFPKRVAVLGQVAPDGRLIIPGGTFDNAIRHLYPIAQFLRDEAGLRLTWEVPGAGPRDDGYLGFVGQPDGWRCFVGGTITPAIWAALNERFVLPRNLVYWPAANTTTGHGMIRDNDNWVDIVGVADPQAAH